MATAKLGTDIKSAKINLRVCRSQVTKAIKGRVWERNKCALEDAKICPDYAAIIFLVEKFIF